jgi:hypothetical protein
LESFVPATAIKRPGGTTHLKIISAGAEILEAETFVVSSSESLILPWNSNSSDKSSECQQGPL